MKHFLPWFPWLQEPGGECHCRKDSISSNFREEESVGKGGRRVGSLSVLTHSLPALSLCTCDHLVASWKLASHT